MEEKKDAGALPGISQKTEDGQDHLINRIHKAVEEKRPFYSFEYFPPKTNEGVSNLFNRMERMSQFEPLFMDITWGSSGSTAQLTMEISATAQQFCSSEVMMHLTCTGLTQKQIRNTLEQAKAAGVRNILALRGEPAPGAEQWEQHEVTLHIE
jgi:methylenetetrahydrofolate reductase (NADPH)